jgi:tetratricopeptide (TPR) repeat protein
MSAGREIRRLRNELGLTQVELGAPLFTHAYVSSIESGRRKPSRRALEHFAARFGVDVDDLAAGRPPGLEADLTLRSHEARLQASSGSPAEASTRFRELIAEARRYGLANVEAKGIEGLALCLERVGDPEKAAEEYERAEEVASAIGPRAVVDPLVGRSRCIAMMGDGRYAIYLLETHLQRLREAGVGDPDSLVRLHSALVSPYFDAGLYKLAVGSADLVMSLRSKIGDPFRAATMFVNVARVLHYQRRHSEALEMLRRAEQLFQKAEYELEEGMAHLAHAFVLSDEDRYEEALRELDEAERALQPATAPTDAARVFTEKGRILRRLQREEEAAEVLHQAIPLLEARDALELAMAHRELALCYVESDAEEAEKHLRSAIEHYERTEDQVQLAVTYRYLGDLYAASGRRAASAEIYRTGLQVLRERS